MSRRRQRGWTLLEILVVIAILAVLVTALGLVAAPRIKARAVETRIKSDLHQVAMAINLYTAENEGGFPLRFRAKDIPSAPHYCQGCSRYSPIPHKDATMLSPTVKNPYGYKWGIPQQQI